MNPADYTLGNKKIALSMPQFLRTLFIMRYILLLLTLCFMAHPVVADDSYAKKAQSWLNEMETATARFKQINHYGESVSGIFYLKKPGRLRFEYDAPVKDYIIADGYLIHFYDGESGQVNSGPIGSTLADFIVSDNVTFDDVVTIDDISETNQSILLTLSQKDKPGMGQLILNFNKDPFTLNGWRIIDAQGLTTDMMLSGLQKDVKLDASLFKMNNRNLN
jgi:outer membrane lipoprotein-sorting protein